ncbi:hypothetical protein ASA1KI_25120 [Opitutales bacterium ASA1]|uniref:phosphatidylglycerophosphatase A family protein n=1 Tax=Congregicoccus parvus TaxID=3081749 RepID=UPI002B2AF5BB|nr:hypothetical protein ASA1KI_25120 [Opitutales bacterium ASA1]
MRAFLRQPAWARLLPDGFVLGLATLGPVGRIRAPGTWGTLAGLIWFTAVLMPMGPAFAFLLSTGLLYLAVVVCGEAEARLRKVDPQEVVLDEFACVPLVLMGSWDLLYGRDTWVVFVLAFALFRLFDIAKPFGIRSLQRFHGGFGVVVDDFAAALAALVVLQLITRLTPLLEWVRSWSA